MSWQSTKPARVIASVTLGVVYAVAAAWCVAHPDSPCVFWTMAMPLLPLAVVILGFHTWRRICPLAAIARVGGMLTTKRRRLPRWVDRRALLIAFGALSVALVMRHVATNGDPHGLGCSLVLIGALAIGTNALFGGKAWCNLLCPVGAVERIYTDEGGLGGASSSRCSRCSGCKSSCPDIDQSRAYAAELGRAERRIVSYAFPGLIFGFYAYYRLRYGEWDAFFGGEWTHVPCDRDLLVGAGFEFAPDVPAVFASSLTLLLCAAMSLIFFDVVERLLARRTKNALLLRHRLVSVASFVAFNLFYVFAGQPALQAWPTLQRVVAFAVPVVATLVLARRWAALGAGGPTRLPVIQTTGDASDARSP